jgi:hypothetical protein
MTDSCPVFVSLVARNLSTAPRAPEMAERNVVGLEGSERGYEKITAGAYGRE